MPMSGDHSRHADGPRKTSAATVTSVATAAAGAATPEAPSGTSTNVSNTIGITVTAISIITVPVTTGANIRRSSDSLAASAN